MWRQCSLFIILMVWGALSLSLPNFPVRSTPMERGEATWPELQSVLTQTVGASLVFVGILTLPVQAGASDLEKGVKLFETNCAGCHIGGGNVIGYARGKTLQKKALEKYGFSDTESIISLLEQGKGVMPRYSQYTNTKDEVVNAKLTKSEMGEVAQYVLNQAEKGWK
ncbi:unnamed protein product [Heterosigma akashiwo]